MKSNKLCQILAGVFVDAVYEMKNYPIVLISTLLVITFVSGGALLEQLSKAG